MEKRQKLVFYRRLPQIRRFIQASMNIRKENRRGVVARSVLRVLFHFLPIRKKRKEKGKKSKHSQACWKKIQFWNFIKKHFFLAVFIQMFDGRIYSGSFAFCFLWFGRYMLFKSERLLESLMLDIVFFLYFDLFCASVACFTVYFVL